MSLSTTALAAQAAPSQPDNGTKAIALNAQTVQQLNNLVASKASLRHAGYVVKALSDGELEQKKRCLMCGVRPNKRPTREPRERQRQRSQPAEAGQQASNGDVARPKLLLRCNFHPGTVVHKLWTCCGQHVTAAPCTGKEHHAMPVSNNRVQLELERRWQFHATAPDTQPNHCVAVAIDCEMGTACDGDSELIRLTVVDYFTGKTLIDSLVYPDIEMRHFNTRWSGITRGAMERSRGQRQCIMGRDAARRAVFDYVGPSTIVVGHGAQNDLSSLRWIHNRVVDSLIIESGIRKEAKLKAEQEKKENEEVDDQDKDKDQGGAREDVQKRGKHHPDGMSLKALTMKRLGRAIQMGKNGHDSLEDALAARDLVHDYTIGLESVSS